MAPIDSADVSHPRYCNALVVQQLGIRLGQVNLKVNLNKLDLDIT